MQVDAIKWLWSLWVKQSGGILADDMGLGKTLASSAFVAGLFKDASVRRVIIVAPKTLLTHWRGELKRIGLAWATLEYTGTVSQRKEQLALAHAQQSVLLTTYGMVLHNKDELNRCASVTSLLPLKYS
jgi:DNA excision repair protein ERCC-6-like